MATSLACNTLGVLGNEREVTVGRKETCCVLCQGGLCATRPGPPFHCERKSWDVGELTLKDDAEAAFTDFLSNSVVYSDN